MRVLHLVPERRPFFDTQVRALEALGVECSVVTVPGDHSPDDPRSPADYLGFYPRVVRSVARDVDVVHANYGLTGPFALGQPRRPVVLTLWGTDLMSGRGWLTRVSRTSARLANATVLPSEAMAPRLGTDDYHLVPFGVDVDRFRPVPQTEARERVGWDTEDPVVLFPYDPSRPEKDFERASRVVERTPVDVQLRAVFGAPYEEMPYYLNASDALLVTSTRESGPMVVKEAAACGLPVVSTDVGFASDVVGVTTGETDDELVTALANAIGHSRADEPRESTFRDEDGLERMGETLLTLYERVAAGGRR